MNYYEINIYILNVISILYYGSTREFNVHWYWILYICKYREQEKIKNVMSADIGNAVQISLGEIISVKIFFFLLGLPF